MGLVDSILSLPAPVLVGLSIALFVAYLVLRYPDRAIGTRRRPDLPRSKTALPVIGDMLSMGKTQPVRLEEMLRRTRENGEMKTWRQTLYHLALGPLDIINCSDPKDVETVLRDPYTFIKGQLFLENLGDFLGKGIFNSDGERWHAQRKTASHIFQVKNFRDVFSGDFVHEVDALCEHLAAASKANAVIDIQDLLLRATLDSFGRLAMGTDFGCIAQKPVIKEGRYMLPDVAFMEAFDYVNMVVSRRMTNPLWKFTEQRDGTTKKVREAQAVMFRFADQIIAEKREKMAKGETIDENGSSSDGKRNADMLDYFMRTKNFDGGLPDNDELRDVIMNVIIAGRDTTAQTLTWVLYEVAQRPDVERKIREEVTAVLGDAAPEYDSLKDLKYTTAVFNETLRLYANVPGNILTVTKDTVLAGTGTQVYAGDRVQYSPWVMGRLKSIWGPDAEEFKPERWIDEKGNLKKENAYKWPVFKAGPRQCLGVNMATQEGVTFLTQIIRRFSLTLVNEDQPQKWGKYDEDPAKREGRYGFALTLCARDTVDFKVHTL